MITECPKCDKIIHGKIGTYRYEESGLDNVYVQNIPVYECSCGAAYASIFRMPRLNDLIAEKLLEKPALLSGKEIKFLRKNLYLSSKAFADTLGLEKTTLSKWENGRQEHSEINDRLIRGVYIIGKGISKKSARNIFSFLAKIQLRRSYIDFSIIAEKIKDGYSLSLQPIPETQADKSALRWVSTEREPQTSSCPRSFALYFSRFRFKAPFMFSSPETLQTRTSLESYGLA